MGLSFGLERGQVSGENLNKARTMVPRALEQYVVELAAKGPGMIFLKSFLNLLVSRKMFYSQFDEGFFLILQATATEMPKNSPVKKARI